MGRPRQYSSATDRQAAYRQRMKETTIWVNRVPYQRIENAIQELDRITWSARKMGNLIARELHRANPIDTLEATVEWIKKYLNLHEIETIDSGAKKCSDPNRPSK
jgi:hypothetical protein